MDKSSSDSERWSEFNQNLQAYKAEKVLPPFPIIETLAKKYLKEPCVVLDVGCSTGNNTIFLIKEGHKIVLLDIASNAIEYCKESLKKQGLDFGIEDCIISRIEDLPSHYGPYKAIVGQCVFPFIPSNIFKEAMRDVLNRIEEGGYFAGGFFGESHPWRDLSDIHVVTVEELRELFLVLGFDILELENKIVETPTFEGIIPFHFINVVAQKRRCD